MNEEVKRVLREKNNVISQEEYQKFFSSINNPNVCWVKYLPDCDKFQATLTGNEFFEFQVEKAKVKVKK